MKNKKNPMFAKSAELREKYEKRVREAVDKKNSRILQARSDFDAEVKTIHREVYEEAPNVSQRATMSLEANTTVPGGIL